MFSTWRPIEFLPTNNAKNKRTRHQLRAQLQTTAAEINAVRHSAPAFGRAYVRVERIYDLLALLVVQDHSGMSEDTQMMGNIGQFDIEKLN
jgi:hypothetical protein